jgi:hypothetical protein
MLFTREILPREGTEEISIFLAESAQTHEHKSIIFNDLEVAEREGFEPSVGL